MLYREEEEKERAEEERIRLAIEKSVAVLFIYL
jgi:hypothetical protein